MRPTHPVPFGPRWRGRWIWHERPAIRALTATRPVADHPVDTVALFRRELELDADPARAVCRLWVDGRYVLVVNGTEVARGPVRSDPRRARYDVVDLAGVLRSGTNVLALTARHFGAATSWWTPVPPTYSLGAGSLVFEAAVDDDWVVSDRSWHCRAGDAWTPVPVPGDVACLPLESFDAERYPDGWEAPDAAPDGWAPAFEITPLHTGASTDPRPPTEPFGMLLPPVRAAFPDGERHTAALGGLRLTTGGGRVDDPVHQVLADERAGTATTPDADVTIDGDGTIDGDVAVASVDLGRIVAKVL